MRTQPALVTAVLLVLATLFVGTSPSTADTFGEQFLDNARYRLMSRALAYFEKPESEGPVLDDDDKFGADARLEFKTDVAWENSELSIGAWVEYGSQPNTYSQADYRMGIEPAPFDTQRKRRPFELNELYWVATRSDFEVTIGRKVIKAGFAPLLSQADRISPVDINDPLDIKQYGVWQLTGEYFHDESRFFISLLPFFGTSKFPAFESRWIASVISDGRVFVQDFQFFDNLYDILEGIEEDHPQQWEEITLRAGADTTVAGWDFFLSAAYGPSVYPVLRAGSAAAGELNLVREYIPATVVSTGFSTVLASLELHGEAVLQISQMDKDDDYVAVIGGATVTADALALKLGLERIELTLDYAFESILDRQDRTGYLQSSEIVRVGQRDLLGLLLVHLNPNWITDVYAHLNLDDQGQLVAAGVRHQPIDGLWLTVQGHFFNGPSDSYYGRWKTNSRLVLGLQYDF